MKNEIMSAKGGSASGGKKLLILVFAVVLLAGCGKQAQTNQAEKKDVFTSIRDAITRSITLRCDYVDPTDSATTITYIRGQMIRMMTGDNTDGSVNFNGLIKDTKFYIWSKDSKQGAVMDLSTLQDSSDMKMGQTQIHSVDDIINELEKEKNKCRQEAIADSMFEVPTDIEFKSWGK
ncbi:MAG: hypothetical protein NTX82_04085 [Candidatus Parcubacteria bacterium]|nr:hypothetical protein [Candidatus Parcubacteria bacterium]